jgi:hypothetical protein
MANGDGLNREYRRARQFPVTAWVGLGAIAITIIFGGLNGATRLGAAEKTIRVNEMQVALLRDKIDALTAAAARSEGSDKAMQAQLETLTGLINVLLRQLKPRGLE